MDLGSIIERIVEVLKTSRLSFNVSEVVKGGSLGHGTAVPGKSDLDMVLYSRDIKPDSVMRDGVDRYINELDAVLRTAFGGSYHCDNKTPFALQFTFRTMSGNELEVDLLPSPYWSSANEFIEYMSRLNPQDRRKFQCSEAKWEKYFFQRQPNEVKEYIRRAKVWRDANWQSHASGTGRPKSFLLSLLIVEGYRRVGRNDPAAITREVKSIVLNHKTLRINWVGEGAEYGSQYIRGTNPPYILDPVNPFNNVYNSGIARYRGNKIREDRYNEGDGNWTNMVRYIGSLDLTRPIY